MLDYIKKNYGVGAPMEITTSEGVFTGEIEFVNEKYIVLRQDDGKVCGIAGTDIYTFKADRPVPQNLPQDECEKTDDAAGLKSDVDSEKPSNETPADNDCEENPVEEKSSLLAENVVEPKVVGHIDLEKLQQIDPKFSRRKYFYDKKEEERPADEAAVQEENQNAVGEETAKDEKYRTDEPYVAPKGRITYYNAERGYGFIREFNTENDLYFKQHQVVDPALYERVTRGAKVVYTTERNSLGLTANCIHLPGTVRNLLPLAEDLLDSRRFYFARGVVEHILEVDPENAEAKDMQAEIRDSAPAPRFVRHENHPLPSSFNPYLTYSQAKRAYLSKDYEQAETLYLQALEANEKPESCIKDLVTLYVSRFKQAESEEDKKAAREKAVAFLEAHRAELPDNLTTLQFLALNYYLPILDYTKFIEIVDEILADEQIMESVSRRVFYLWQKGIALNKLGRKEEALALVEDTLKLSPRNRQLLNLQYVIQHPELLQKDEPAEAE